jgi:hypothetical protein
MDTALRRTWRSADTMSLMPPKREGTTLLNKAVQINLPRVFGATPSAGFCLGTLIFIGATQLIGSESDHCSFGGGVSPPCFTTQSVDIDPTTDQVGWHNLTNTGPPQCQNPDVGGLRGDRDHSRLGAKQSSSRGYRVPSRYVSALRHSAAAGANASTSASLAARFGRGCARHR